jgi:hypothetical protein
MHDRPHLPGVRGAAEQAVTVEVHEFVEAVDADRFDFAFTPPGIDLDRHCPRRQRRRNEVGPERI